MNPASLLKRRETVLALLILALVAGIGVRAPIFVSAESLGAVIVDSSILIMLALGQTMVLLTRGIDLSVAANLALTGMACALLSQAMPDLPIAALLVFAVVVGTGLGAINAAMIAGLGLPPIVATLGTLSIYRGAIFVLSGGDWVVAHQMTPAFMAFPIAAPLVLPNLVWLALLAVAGATVFLTLTRRGRELYAIGGNPITAGYVGIPVRQRLALVYIVSGAIAGLCGYLWVARYAIAYTEVAQGFELTVIAACVIGGVSIGGGIGTVAGAVLGALFLGVVNNALPVINVSPFWQMAIAGIVILAAVVVNSRSRAKVGKRILRHARTA
jgi:rhamnose transport system permease protein